MSTLATPLDPRDRAAAVPSADDPRPETDRLRADRRSAEREARTHRRVVTGIFVGYLVFFVAISYAKGGGFLTPEKIAILFLGGALVLGQGKAFIRDWAPFILLFFGYEAMRGVADDLAGIGALTAEDHGRVLVQSLIDADKLLFFGHVPTIWLQDRLYDPSRTHWYDAMSALVYVFHFVLPLAFGFLLWARTRAMFRRFTLTLMAMSYSAFVFFLLVPAAPPWMAHDWGYLDDVARPSQAAYKLFLPQRFADVDTFKLWTTASPNPVAALPSLHAAFPWLVLLFAVQVFGRWGWLTLPYNAAVWFAVVYLSQHWVVDILAGMALATAWWWGMNRFLDRGGRMREEGEETTPEDRSGAIAGSAWPLVGGRRRGAVPTEPGASRPGRAPAP